MNHAARALLVFLALSPAASFASAFSATQTGRFTPDQDIPGVTIRFLGSPIATGEGRVVVGEPEVGELYVHDASDGSQITKLQPSVAPPGGFFGRSVAMEGSTAVVGSNGAAFLFDIAAGTEIGTLTPTTPLPAGATFGSQVAIDGGVALVSTSGATSGEGLVYAFDVATGAEIATLAPGDGAADNGFGLQIALDGDFAIVGALSDTEGGANAGAAYLYDLASGAEVTKLIGPGPNLFFGAGVALDDGIAFVGEPSGDDENLRRVGIYDASTGAGLGSLPDGGEVADASFGSFLAAEDGRLLVGSIFDADSGTSDSGAAYLYDVATREQLLRIAPTDGVPYGEFGFGVAMADGFVASIAGQDETAAYTFRLVVVPEPSAWLLASLASCGAGFARRVRTAQRVTGAVSTR